MQFIRARGTRRGIMMALRLALEPTPSQMLFDDPETGEAAGIRIVEQFAARLTGALAPAAEDVQTAFTLRTERWTPSQGSGLHRRYPRPGQQRPRHHLPAVASFGS